MRPEVHSPNQPEGDIAKLPLFPTMAKGRGGTVHERDQSAYRDALDPAMFDVQPRPIRALSCCQPKRPAMRFPYRNMFEGPGSITARILAMPFRNTDSTKKAHGPMLRSGKELEPRSGCHVCTLIEPFVSRHSLQLAVEAICKADVAVFDTTDFKQPGLMLLLGVRSVARRGTTIYGA